MTRRNARLLAVSSVFLVAAGFNACSGGFKSNDAQSGASSSGPGGTGTTPDASAGGVTDPSPGAGTDTGNGGGGGVTDPGTSTPPTSTPDPSLPASPRVKFTTQPGGAGVAIGWAQQPVVTIYDSSGNVQKTNANVRLTLQNNSGNAVLYGLNVNQQAVNGVATFSNLSIDRAGSYILTATVPGIGSTASAAFTVNASVGQTYYVSPTGNDSNAGTSTATAWKTVAKAGGMTYKAGDSLLFQGGQAFSGCLTIGPNVKSTPAQPFTIGSYGGGPFTLNANCTKTESNYDVLSNRAAVSVGVVNGFVLQDCILRGNGSSTAGNTYGAAYGVLFNNGTYNSNQTTSGVTIQRCDISGFYTTASSDFAGDIFFNLNGPTKHISLLNNVVHGSSGPNSPDDNGVAGNGASMDGRLVDVTVQGNHVYDIGGRGNGPGGTIGSGIMMAGARILVQNNVVHDTGANTKTCGGPSNIWFVSADQGLAQYNEVYRSRPRDLTLASGGPNAGGCDWDGFDMDIGVTNSVIQFNYSHENFGSGLLAYVAETWGPNTYRYNISVGDGGGSFSIADWSGASGTIHAYNNVLDAYDASDFAFVSGGTATNGYMANNVWRAGVDQYGQSPMANTNGGVPSKMKLISNAYWTMSNDVTALFFNWGSRYRGLPAFQSGAKQDTGGLVFTSSQLPGMAVPAKPVTCDVANVTKALDQTALVKCLGNYYQTNANSPLNTAGVDLRGSSFNVDIGVSNFWGEPLPAVGSKMPIGP